MNVKVNVKDITAIRVHMWLKLFSQSLQNETVITMGNIITLCDRS